MTYFKVTAKTEYDHDVCGRAVSRSKIELRTSSRIQGTVFRWPTGDQHFIAVCPGMCLLASTPLIDYDGVRVCLRTEATNWPIVHPPGDM
jgi:hypothetical protein